MKISEVIREQATAGATSAGNIASLANPHVAAGPDRFKKSYTGSPGKSGTKAPKLPKLESYAKVTEGVAFLKKEKEKKNLAQNI